MKSIEDILVDIQCKGQVEAEIGNEAGLEFIYRPLSYLEYTHAHKLSQLSDADAHEWILLKTILYPYESNLRAWIDTSEDPMAPDKVAEFILQKSYFSSPQDIVNLYHETFEHIATDFMALAQIHIATSFGISILELEKLSMQRIIELLIKSEHVKGEPINIDRVLLNEEMQPEIQLPIAPGMETTDLHMTKEFLLDPANSSPIPPEAFNGGRT